MIAEILKKYPFIVLDGAFSTELEKQGFAINDELWSAIALYKNPELVEAVHLSYYEAGADIVTSASYQATSTDSRRRGSPRKKRHPSSRAPSLSCRMPGMNTFPPMKKKTARHP